MTLLTIKSGETNRVVSPVDVAAIVDATEPFEVRLDEVHAGPVMTAAAEMQVELGRGEPSYGYVAVDEVLLVRLEHRLSCFVEVGGPSTDIRAHHIVAFRVLKELQVDAAVISAWIETNVYFMAYPYVRQFFTQITGSLGLPPVVLGYMKRDQWPYVDDEVLALESVSDDPSL